MAWIRLDDQIGHHPKFLKAGLSSWLWVCCIGFSQKFLTDGFIPDEAVSSVCGGVERPLVHFQKLVKVGLLDRVKDGYQVHDYLLFNDSAEVVKKKREDDKARKHGRPIPTGIQPDSERNPEIVLARAPASHPIRSISSDPNNKLERENSVSTTSGGNGHAPRASLSRSAPDAFTNPDITERAGRFVEHYAELYPKYRNGARYAVKPVRDYAAAVTLCRTWPDDERLHKLAVCFLTTDHKFAEEGSRTISQFLALASWADGELSAWEQKNQPTKTAQTSDAPKPR